MRTLSVIALAWACLAGAAQAQAYPNLDAFVVAANRVPLNPTSALRADARRLVRETNAGFSTVGGEIRAARAANRRPPACPPDRIQLNPRQLLGFLNAIPQERRRRMSVTDGLRAWMADRYPCPA